MAHAGSRPPTEGVAMKKSALLVVLLAVVALVLKRQRDRELDEAIWEEPTTV